MRQYQLAWNRIRRGVGRYIWLMKWYRATGDRWYHLVWETTLLVVSKQHRQEKSLVVTLVSHVRGRNPKEVK